MKSRLALTVVALAAVGLAGCMTKDTRSDILKANLESHITYLASDSLEGRLVGTPGIDKAGRYVAGEFEKIGLDPLFDGSYFQEFEMEFGFDLDSLPALHIGKTQLSLFPEEFTVLPISGAGLHRGPMSLGTGGDQAGKGLISFILIDPRVVEERWTMTGRDGLLEWMREVSAEAAASGAGAVVFVSGSPEEPDAFLYGFATSRTYRPADLPAFEVTYVALRRALAQNGISLETLVEQMRSDNGAPVEVSPSLECVVEASARPETIMVRNIGGIRRGMGPGYVVIGAHYDHLGYGHIASSTPWRREVHPGADDNASGVAGVIETARILASYDEPERSTIFLAFTAEELGALGSEHYCVNAPCPIDSTVAMINLDTVGRLEEGKIIVFGAKSAEEMSGLLAEAGAGCELTIIEKEEIYGFSDQNPFYARGVPALHFFTGAHDDYHSPDDTWEKINFGGLASVTTLVADLASLMVFSPRDLTPVVVEPESGETPSRGRGAHLGIIPDFTYAGTGVGIKGTVPESPAEQAGLKDGDVIVGIDNQPITDLKGLMGFLVSRNPGDRIAIQVMRGSLVESVEATLSVRSARGHSD